MMSYQLFNGLDCIS